ncbi:hypothetical protein SH139x_005718 [Planctomycetaceae bacterium SH139]
MVEMYVIRPMQWELNKFEIRGKLLAQRQDIREAELNRLASEVEALSMELHREGIASEDDLIAMQQKQRGVKQQILQVEAEIRALREMSEKSPALSRTAELDLQQAKVKLEAEHQKVAAIKKNLDRLKKNFEQGLLSSTQLEDAMAEWDQQRALAQLAEIDLERTMAEAKDFPELRNELRKMTMMRDRLAVEIEERGIDGDKLVKLRRMLVEKQRKSAQLEMSVKRLDELGVQMDQLQMERRYLEELLSRFERAAEASAATKEGQKAADDGAKEGGGE